MPEDPVDIARKMIGGRVDDRLIEMLRKAEERIRFVKPDGDLRSTQTIASIIAIWEATGGAA